MNNKYTKVDGYEIDSRTISSNGSEEVISLLLKSNVNTSVSVNEILEIVNKNKRRKLNRTNIDRTIKNLKKHEAEILKSKKISNTTFYWLSKKETKNQEKTFISKLSQEKNYSVDNSKNDKYLNKYPLNAKNLNTEKEKDLYNEVNDWLTKYIIDGNKFKYQISGERFLDSKSKFSNPDLVGINQPQGYDEFQVVSVEVKKDLDNNAELIGFAQCCSYLLFSHYVLFVCKKPKMPEFEERVLRLTNLCSHFGIGLRFIGEIQLRVKPRLNEPKETKIKNRIIERFQK